MLHFAHSHASDVYVPAGSSLSIPPFHPQLGPAGSGWSLPTGHNPPTPPSLGDNQSHKLNAVVHWTQSGHSFTSGSKSDDDESHDTDSRPFTPPPPRERLSYTRYQLELLNGVYKEVKYPNSTQKLLIAKRVGITRDQVKIWFQNRRRKDVLAKQGKKDDEGSEKGTPSNSPKSVILEENDENLSEGMVPNLVMDSIINELIRYKNEHLKSKKAKSKKKTTDKKDKKAETCIGQETNSQPKPSWELFSGFDMVSPPNQITPSAFEKVSNQQQYFQHNKAPLFNRIDLASEAKQHSTSTYYNLDCSQSSSKYGYSNDFYHSQNQSYGQGRRFEPSAERQGHAYLQDTSNRQTYADRDAIHRQAVASSVFPNQGQVDTIPVLSDLLGHSSRHSPSDMRSRQNSCSPENPNPTHLDLGNSYSPPPNSHTSQTGVDSYNSTRPFHFPVSGETSNVAQASVKIPESFRPQPYYPQYYPSQDFYQSLPFSSLSNQYYSHNQSTMHCGTPWSENSSQDQHL